MVTLLFSLSPFSLPARPTSSHFCLSSDNLSLSSSTYIVVHISLDFACKPMIRKQIEMEAKDDLDELIERERNGNL